MKFFLVILFLTVVSFVNTFLVILVIRRVWGTEGFMGQYGKYIAVPIVVILYNLLMIWSGEQWMFVVGAIPFLVMLGLYVFIRFSTEVDEPDQEKKKPLSNKSRRIHEAREKRMQEREGSK